MSNERLGEFQKPGKNISLKYEVREFVIHKKTKLRIILIVIWVTLPR
jgi:predicted transglutaminase-like protease